MCEVWKRIKSFEHYEVSNRGKVKKVNSKLELSQRLSKGKVIVGLTKSNGKKTTREVGKLVLTAFKKLKPTTKYIAKHLDGDPWNNKISNLVWSKRSRRTGNIIYLSKPGIKHEYRTFRNAAKFLGIPEIQANLITVTRKAKCLGYSVNVKKDYEAFIDDDYEVLTTTPYDEKHTSNLEEKQKIRNVIDDFVDYCDTHYSTCNKEPTKGVIDEIDESDPVVIAFRQFLKEHNM